MAALDEEGDDVTVGALVTTGAEVDDGRADEVGEEVTALDDTTGDEVDEADDDTGEEVSVALEVEEEGVDDDTAGDDVDDEIAVDEGTGALLDDDTAGGAELTPEPVTASAKVASVVAVLYSVT